MIALVSSIAAIGVNSKFLWYVTRATGIIAILLLGLVVLLGLVTASKSAPKGFAKFLVPDLHRRLSITAVGFLVVHILSAVADTFVKISLVSAVIPFVSAYRPLWVGLGAIAFDLILVLIGTSLVRHRMTQGPWKKIHYLSWIVVTLGLFHAIGTGSDAKVGLVEAIYIIFVAIVMVAAALRTFNDKQLRKVAKFAGSTAIVAVPAAAVAWSFMGPLKTGWAASSSSLSPLPKVTTTTAGTSTTAKGSLVWPVNSGVSGTASVVNSSTGATVTLSGSVTGTPDKLVVRLVGQVQEGALALQESSVAIGTAASPSIYTGSVAQAQGSTLVLVLKGPSGQVGADLNVSISGKTFSGILRAPISLGAGSESQ